MSNNKENQLNFMSPIDIRNINTFDANQTNTELEGLIQKIEETFPQFRDKIQRFNVEEDLKSLTQSIQKLNVGDAISISDSLISTASNLNQSLKKLFNQNHSLDFLINTEIAHASNDIYLLSQKAEKIAKADNTCELKYAGVLSAANDKKLNPLFYHLSHIDTYSKPRIFEVVFPVQGAIKVIKKSDDLIFKLKKEYGIDIEDAEDKVKKLINKEEQLTDNNLMQLTLIELSVNNLIKKHGLDAFVKQVKSKEKNIEDELNDLKRVIDTLSVELYETKLALERASEVISENNYKPTSQKTKSGFKM